MGRPTLRADLVDRLRHLGLEDLGLALALGLRDGEFDVAQERVDDHRHVGRAGGLDGRLGDPEPGVGAVARVVRLLRDPLGLSVETPERHEGAGLRLGGDPPVAHHLADRLRQLQQPHRVGHRGAAVAVLVGDVLVGHPEDLDPGLPPLGALDGGDGLALVVLVLLHPGHLLDRQRLQVNGHVPDGDALDAEHAGALDQVARSLGMALPDAPPGLPAAVPDGELHEPSRRPQLVFDAGVGEAAVDPLGLVGEVEADQAGRHQPGLGVGDLADGLDRLDEVLELGLVVVLSGLERALDGEVAVGDDGDEDTHGSWG